MGCGWITYDSAIAGAFLELTKAGIQFIFAGIYTWAVSGSSRTIAESCGPQRLAEEAEGGGSSLHDAELLQLGMLAVLLMEERDRVFRDTTELFI